MAKGAIDWSGVNGGAGAGTMFSNVTQIYITGARSIVDSSNILSPQIIFPTNYSQLDVLSFNGTSRGIYFYDLTLQSNIPSSLASVRFNCSRVQLKHVEMIVDTPLTFTNFNNTQMTASFESVTIIGFFGGGTVTFGQRLADGKILDSNFPSTVTFSNEWSRFVVTGCIFGGQLIVADAGSVLTVSFANNDFRGGVSLGTTIGGAATTGITDVSFSSCEFNGTNLFARDVTRGTFTGCVFVAGSTVRFSAGVTDARFAACSIGSATVDFQYAGGGGTEVLTALNMTGNTFGASTDVSIAEYTSPTNLIFSDNNFTTVGGFGNFEISLATGTLQLSDIIIQSNKLEGILFTATAGSIDIADTVQICRNNAFRITLSATSPGNSISGVGSLRLDGNVLYNTTSSITIQAEDVSLDHGSISDNIFLNQRLQIGVITGGAGVTLVNFHICGNLESSTSASANFIAIGQSGSPTTLTNCSISNNTGDTISLTGNPLTVTRTACSNNRHGFINWSSPGDVIVTECALIGNTLSSNININAPTTSTAASVMTGTIIADNVAFTMLLREHAILRCAIVGNRITGNLSISVKNASPLGMGLNTIGDNQMGSLLIGGVTGSPADIYENVISGNRADTTISIVTSAASSNNTNVVTGNRAPSGFPGFTNFASSGYPNDILDTGVAPIVAGIGFNR